MLETLPKTIAFLASPMSFIMIFQSEPWQERWGEISSSLVWWNPSSSSCQTAAAQHTAVCKHTWGLCWKWFNLAHAIQLVTTLPTPPPHTHTQAISPRLCSLKPGWQTEPLLSDSSTLGLPALLVFWKSIFQSFCSDQQPGSLASTPYGTTEKEQHFSSSHKLDNVPES